MIKSAHMELRQRKLFNSMFRLQSVECRESIYSESVVYNIIIFITSYFTVLRIILTNRLIFIYSHLKQYIEEFLVFGHVNINRNKYFIKSIAIYYIQTKYTITECSFSSYQMFPIRSDDIFFMTASFKFLSRTRNRRLFTNWI